MKIAFLLTQLEVGGAQVRVMQTAEEMRKRGFEADVIFLYKKREAFENDAKIVLSDSGGAAGVLKAVMALPGVLRGGGYSALITNTAPSNIIGNSVAAMLGLRKRIAYQTQPPGRLNALYRLLDRVVGSVGIYRFNIANSDWTRSCFDSYPAAYRNRMHIVTDGIVPRVSSLTKVEARAVLGWKSNERIVLNIGRLSRQKGQDTLLRAIAALPDVRLVVTGDGELMEETQQLAQSLGIRDRVEFTGEVPGDRVATLLRGADVFAFPSRWETFGLAVVEAAAAGLPIVASDLDVLKEVLMTPEASAAAVFVPADDASAFASEIGRVLQDGDLAAELGRRSLAVAGQHSMSRHADRLIEALEGL